MPFQCKNFVREVFLDCLGGIDYYLVYTVVRLIFLSVYCKFLDNGLQVFPKRRKACYIILNIYLFVTSLALMCIIVYCQVTQTIYLSRV